MLKLSALIGTFAFMFSSWFSGVTLPRFTQGPADYFLMPLFSFIMVIVAAQVAARFVKEQ